MPTIRDLVVNIYYFCSRKLLHPQTFRIWRKLLNFFIHRALTGSGIERQHKVLIIRVDGIGDLVWSSGLLREVRHLYPNSHITLLVSRHTYNLAETCIYVDRVIPLTVSLTGRLQAVNYLKASLFAHQRLRPFEFDLAILPRRDLDSSCGLALTYFSGAPVRIGHSSRVKEWANPLFPELADQLLTNTISNSKLQHEVEHNADIARYIGARQPSSDLEIWLDESDTEFAERILKPLVGRCIVSLGIGAGALNRVWPVSNYVELAAWVSECYNAVVVIVGGPSDKASGSLIEGALKDGCLNIVGASTLRQTAAVMRHCSLHIGNDSGAAHMAAAVRVPVVIVSPHSRGALVHHPSSPVRCRPWGVKFRIVQPDSVYPECYGACTSKIPHCISRVSIDEVKIAVTEIFQCLRPSADLANPAVK